MIPFTELTLTRDIVIILHAAVVLYSLLFFGTFLNQWAKSPLRKLTDIRLAWAVFMLGMVLNTFSFIMTDFYFTVDPEALQWTKTGYIAMMLALVGFFLALERILPYKTKNVFTGSVIIIAFVTVFASREWLSILALFASLFAFGMLALFFQYYVKNTTGTVRRSMRMIFFGVLIGFVGYLLRSDPAYYIFGEQYYVMGAAFLVTGLVILGIAILSSPTLDELDWDEQMLELYVIHSAGVLMFHHKFKTAVNIDRNLTAAGITGVQELVMEITQSKAGLNNLSVGDYDILFAQKENFISMLLAKESYVVLLEKVRDFADRFEMFYGDALEKFTGEVTQFETASTLVKSLFTPEA
ncbi:MAG: hypothetical protein ACFFE6_03270 [Candidatus Thorarchaeota archaeon]